MVVSNTIRGYCWTPQLGVIVGHHHEELLLDTTIRRYCWTPPLGVIVGHHHEELLLDTTLITPNGGVQQ
jgi:hypothetical protein